MKQFVKHQWGKLTKDQKSVAYIIAGLVLIIIVLS